MVKGREKSGRFRKKQVKVPGGRTKMRYLERTPKRPHCAETGEALHGIPRLSATAAKNAPKSAKRPERPYGGSLSSGAMRRHMKRKALALSGEPGKEAALYSVGRLCLKIAGRDAGKRCVILSEPKDGKALIDGETRRRTCSLHHLEPLSDVLDVKADAADVGPAFKKLGIELKKTKPKKTGERPKRVRKKKEKPAPKKVAKKSAEPAEKAAPTEPKAAPAAPAQSPKPATPSPKAGAKVEKAKVEEKTVAKKAETAAKPAAKPA